MPSVEGPFCLAVTNDEDARGGHDERLDDKGENSVELVGCSTGSIGVKGELERKGSI